MSFNFKTDDSFELMGLNFTKNERVTNEKYLFFLILNY